MTRWILPSRKRLSVVSCTAAEAARFWKNSMGFERACSIIQNTKGFTDFSIKPSNYATDVFQPIFRKLEELSGKTYVNIYPELGADRSAFTEEMKDAIAFRVIADHLRTLSFSIADGIMGFLFIRVVLCLRLPSARHLAMLALPFG